MKTEINIKENPTPADIKNIEAAHNVKIHHFKAETKEFSALKEQMDKLISEKAKDKEIDLLKAKMEKTPQFIECWLKTAGKWEIQRARKAEARGEMEYNEHLIRDCIKAGSKKFIEDDYYYLGLELHIGKLLSIATVELKN